MLRSVPLSEKFDLQKDCDSCGALSANAVQFDHDFYADSLLQLVVPGSEICDSLCMDGKLISQNKVFWDRLAASMGPEFFEALDRDPWIEWSEHLQNDQKQALAHLRTMSGANYLLLPLWDHVSVRSKINRQGSYDLDWALSFWDLRSEKLLWAIRLKSKSGGIASGEIDRLWHQSAVAFMHSKLSQP